MRVEAGTKECLKPAPGATFFAAAAPAVQTSASVPRLHPSSPFSAIFAFLCGDPSPSPAAPDAHVENVEETHLSQRPNSKPLAQTQPALCASPPEIPIWGKIDVFLSGSPFNHLQGPRPQRWSAPLHPRLPVLMLSRADANRGDRDRRQPEGDRRRPGSNSQRSAARQGEGARGRSRGNILQKTHIFSPAPPPQRRSPWNAATRCRSPAADLSAPITPDTRSPYGDKSTFLSQRLHSAVAMRLHHAGAARLSAHISPALMLKMLIMLKKRTNHHSASPRPTRAPARCSLPMAAPRFPRCSARLIPIEPPPFPPCRPTQL
jgi:hypothetical protein